MQSEFNLLRPTSCFLLVLLYSPWGDPWFWPIRVFNTSIFLYFGLFLIFHVLACLLQHGNENCLTQEDSYTYVYSFSSVYQVFGSDLTQTKELAFVFRYFVNLCLCVKNPLQTTITSVPCNLSRGALVLFSAWLCYLGSFSKVRGNTSVWSSLWLFTFCRGILWIKCRLSFLYFRGNTSARLLVWGCWTEVKLCLMARLATNFRKSSWKTVSSYLLLLPRALWKSL